MFKDTDFFDVVALLHFKKKTQKTPKQEIEKALKIKEEYYDYKRQHADRC
jgi:phage-related protein